MKQLRTVVSPRAVRFRIIRHLVTHARRQGKNAAIFQLGMQLAGQAQQDMAFTAPVVGQVTCGVLHHPHPHRAKLLRAPPCRALLTRMFRRFQC